MNTNRIDQQIPTYSLEPDEVTGSRQFKVYNYEGILPNQAELLIPHRKTITCLCSSGGQIPVSG